MDIDFDAISKMLTGLAITYATKVALALITLIIGLWVIGIVVKIVKSLMEKNKIDANVQPFLVSLLSVSLRIILLISVASILGIETTSFVAVVGAAGLAVGLALQGSLSNFAGSVLILVFKPFKAGDIIQAQGYTGLVKEIQTFHTALLTLDNRVIIIPNGPLAGGALVNYSAEPQRRIDLAYRVHPTSDVHKVRKILLEVASKDTRLLKNPAPEVVVSQLFDNGMEFTLFIWVTSTEFVASSPAIIANTHEQVKLAFIKEGIDAPPQGREVLITERKVI